MAQKMRGVAGNGDIFARGGDFPLLKFRAFYR